MRSPKKFAVALKLYGLPDPPDSLLSLIKSSSKRQRVCSKVRLQALMAGLVLDG